MQRDKVVIGIFLRYWWVSLSGMGFIKVLGICICVGVVLELLASLGGSAPPFGF